MDNRIDNIMSKNEVHAILKEGEFVVAQDDVNFKPGTQARVILDSISPNGDRLTTFEVVMHRFVLAEFNTHRVFSRNSASSRAIPVEKQLARVLFHPAWPVSWPAEQAGMQGGNELEGDDLDDAQLLFEGVWRSTVRQIDEYLANHPDKSTRLHKSLINRLLEPFMWHTVIVTATDWENFYHQRLHKAAQPEIREAAEAMHYAFNDSTPQEVSYGDWHMPYIDGEDYSEAEDYILSTSDHYPDTSEFYPRITEVLRQVSAARCARVSYLTHDGHRAIEKDLELYARLVERAEGNEDPIHWSPLEHVATPSAPLPVYGVHDDIKIIPATAGNFAGWHQLRHWR